MGVVWAVMATAVAIVAIISGTYTERQKHKQTLEAANSASGEDLKLLLAENENLAERVKNLEAIITNLDEDLLLLNTVETDSQDKVKRLAEKIQKKNNE